MRKMIRVLVPAVLSVMMVFTGCGNKTNEDAVAVDTVSDTADTVKEEETEAGETELPEQDKPEEAELPEERVTEEESEIDLTVLSATMVYSQVYDMMVDPKKYIGKNVKMSGMYSVFYDELKDKRYHACIISDATACCSQGIEFELTDDYKYPDDYPEEAEDICVSGTFDTYKEDGYDYCVLKDARIEKQQS